MIFKVWGIEGRDPLRRNGKKEKFLSLAKRDKSLCRPRALCGSPTFAIGLARQSNKIRINFDQERKHFLTKTQDAA
jgi:hypothetical protein